MNLNRLFFFSIILASQFIFIQTIFSQEVFFINGYVYDLETNEPVSNANISVDGLRSGTSSDKEGLFELGLTAGEFHIVVSSLGFLEKTVVVNVPSEKMKELKIGLQPIIIDIEGIDVFGRLFFPERDSSVNREQISLLPAITRISSFEIEKQGAVTLTDAVKYIPGGWTETRGRKTKQFFSVRGQRYPYPEYSVNGIWQKEFEETSYFFSALDIESVEVVRSSSALVKGLSGLTGMIDVKTKRPERETISLIAKYGQQNNYATNFHYGNKINDFTLNTSVAFFGTDGPPGRNGNERISNFNGHLEWDIGSRFKLSAGSTYIGGSRGFISIIDAESSSPNLLEREEAFDPLRSLISYAKINYEGEDGSLTELQTNLSSRNAFYVRYDLPGQEPGQEKDWEYGFNILHSRPISSTNTLRAGVLYNHWEAPWGKRYYAGRACNVHTWSGVIASEQKAGRFLFDGGLRVISGYIVEFGGFGVEGSAAGLQSVDPIENEMAPFEWQSIFGISYLLSNKLSLHYNFAGGTIAPRRGSSNEQGIRPANETRLQHDLGFIYESAGNNEVAVSAFFAQRQDALELSGATVISENDHLVELYENIDKLNYGIELSTKLNVRILHSFLFANATLMKGKNEISDGMEKDNKLPGIILNTGVLFEYAGYDANIFVNYTGPYTNNRFVRGPWIAEHGDFPLGDFVAVDITTGYSFEYRYSARIFLEIRNVLDQKYLTVAGYPDTGRLFHSGIKISF